MLQVRRGAVLREREWAALAVRIAVRRRRDALASVLVLPTLAVLGMVVGTSAGRVSRGADFRTTVETTLTWHYGIPWIVGIVVTTGLLLLATRDWRRRLRAAEEGNRQRARPSRPPAEIPHESDALL